MRLKLREIDSEREQRREKKNERDRYDMHITKMNEKEKKTDRRQRGQGSRNITQKKRQTSQNFIRERRKKKRIAQTGELCM